MHECEPIYDLYTLCLPLLCKNILYMTHRHSGNSGMQNVVLFTYWRHKEYFQALLCFYTRIFQTNSNQGVYLKLLCNCHFICEMAKKTQTYPRGKNVC